MNKRSTNPTSLFSFFLMCWIVRSRKVLYWRPSALALTLNPVNYIRSSIPHKAMQVTLNYQQAQQFFQSYDVNIRDSYFLAALFFAFFNPMAWNAIGRLEYKTHLFTRVLAGQKRTACYFFAAFIFIIGIVRDFMYL